MALDYKPVTKKKDKTKKDKDLAFQNINAVTKIKAYLTSRYEIRCNVLNYTIEIKNKGSDHFRIMDDFIFNDILTNLIESDFKKANASTLDMILKSSFSNLYNPIKQYFKELPSYDGHDYIKDLADTIQIENLSSGDIQLQDLWLPYLRKWLVASVCEALNMGNNHTCLILVGGQGKGKTSWLNNLCPKVLDNYLVCSHINPTLTDPNTNNYLAEKWFVNIDDQLETIFGKDFNSMKAIVTTPSVTNRKVYARITKKRPRICSFMGSVNNAKFLSDTENRRYLVFSVTDVDYQHTVDIDKVWSQAYHLAKEEYQYWFDHHEIKQLNTVNEIYRQHTLEEEWLMKLYAPCKAEDPKAHFMMSSEMLSQMSAYSGFRLSSKKLSQAMDKLQFGMPISKRIKGVEHPRKVYPVRMLTDAHEHALQKAV